MRSGVAGASAGEAEENGTLAAVDDSRSERIWKEVEELGLPVLIHLANPEAFFVSTDRFSERWEELAHTQAGQSMRGPMG